MGRSPLHQKLFESHARELDRRVRAHFVGTSLRPDYAKNFQRDLQHLMIHSQAGLEVGGRFLWAKRAFRRMLRPFVAHQDRINRLIADRLGDLHESLHQLAELAAERDAAWTSELDRRIEELRERIVGDLDGAALAASSESPSNGHANGRSIPRGARVVVGPAPMRREGFLHVDSSPGENVDLVVDLAELPAEPGSLAEIVVVNALEAFPASFVRERLIPGWAALLGESGRLSLTTDDFGALFDRLEDGDLDRAEILDVLYAPLAAGRPRRSAYSPETLRDLLEGAGLVDVAIADRRQDPEARAFGLEAVGSKPSRRPSEVLS